MRFIYFGMCFFFAAVPREVADGTYNNMAALFRLSSFDSDVFKQKKKKKEKETKRSPQSLYVSSDNGARHPRKKNKNQRQTQNKKAKKKKKRLP